MRIKKISIRNLKLLDYVELNFDKDITLLYGNNGIGKTTFLEAISLIGHLSTMRCIKLVKKRTEYPHIEPSRFWNELIEGRMIPIREGVDTLDQASARQWIYGYNKDETFKELAESLKTANQNLDEWFDKFNITGSAIRFEVEIDGRDIVICVYRREEESENDRLSITQALGRKKCDDLKMNEIFAVIWDSEHTRHIEALIENCIKNCTYIIALNTVHQKGLADHYYFLKHSFKEASENLSTGYVFYLNTDLNDFGRMRDIRESVKDLESDFVQEWIHRFKIKFNTPTATLCQEFDKKAELELLMNIIMAKSSPFSFWRGIKEFLSILSPFPLGTGQVERVFELTDCCIKKDGSLELRARRKGYKQSQRVDYLSAGENECFFIFLYLLGTETRNSICLLDEPDLHLSQFSKRPFFERLFAMLKEKNCQVIMSTHSGFAYTHPRYTKRFLIRRLNKPKPHFDTKFTLAFQLGLAAHYWRTAFGVLGIAGGFQIAILVIMLFATGSFISDIFGAAGEDVQRSSTHIELTEYFTHPAIIIASVLAYVQFIRSVFSDIRGALGWKDMD